jgi:hypothetical protein
MGNVQYWPYSNACIPVKKVEFLCSGEIPIIEMSQGSAYMKPAK